jgi:hypothetical protein
MSRWILWTVGAVVLCAVAAAVGSALLSRSACRAATKNGTVRDFRNLTGDELERDVRAQVPLGSSRTFIENFLTKEEMKFSYDSSLNATLASAPCLKGSGIVVSGTDFSVRPRIKVGIHRITRSSHRAVAIRCKKLAVSGLIQDTRM